MKMMMIMLAGLLILGCTADDTEAYRPVSGYDQKQENVDYGTLEAKSYYSTTCGKYRDCMVYLPAGYTPEKAYPVLYLLHGIGGNHLEWAGGKPDVIVGNLVAAGEAREMIIVTPNVKAFPSGVSSANLYGPETFQAFDNFINDLRDDLMPFIKENYSVLDGRENTAVAGLSMGGREALYIGLSMQDTFGFVGAFAPAPGVLPYFAEKGLFETAAFKVQEGYEDTYILINAGKSDNVVGEWPVTYANTLKQNGTACVFYEMPGGHDFNVWKNGLYHFAKAIFQD